MKGAHASLILFSLPVMKSDCGKFYCVTPAQTPPRCPSVPQETLVTGSFDLQDVLFYGGCGFTIMRCMSFALENCDRKEGSYSFLDLLKYNFYLPFFFFGPIMTFDQFHAQVCPQSGRIRARITVMGFHTLMCC